MSGSSHLTVRAELCTQCGRCVPACPEGAIKIGPGYIYVDEKRCTMCAACVDACEPKAIGRSVTPARSGAVPAVAVGDVAKVVVGSRAEAKALRKAAQNAKKSRGKGAKAAARPAKVVSRAPAYGATPVVAGSSAGGAGESVGVASATASARPAETRAQSAIELGGPPRNSVPWTLVDVAVLLGMLLVTMLVKDRILGLHAVSLMPDTGKTFVRAGVLTLYYCVQLGTLAWLAARHKSRMLAAFGIGGGSAGDETRAGSAPGRDLAVAGGSVGLVVLLFVGTEAFAVAYEYAMQLMGLAQPARLSSDLTAVFGGGGVGMALSVVLVAIVAPLVEELAFRGVLQPVLGARLSAWPAIVLGAAIYAAFHLNAWLFLPTMVLGVALGWLAWTRRSLAPAIALHTLYNTAAVLASFALSRFGQ